MTGRLCLSLLQVVNGAKGPRMAFTLLSVTVGALVLTQCFYNGINLPSVKLKSALRQRISNIGRMLILEENENTNITAQTKTNIKSKLTAFEEIAKFYADRPQKRKPRCIIIGAMKTGTYALRTFLTINPYIVAAHGEINYFNLNYNKGVIWYKNKMPMSTLNQITVEKSIYFLYKSVPERIYRFNKDMKLILVVRDPVIRAISHYVHMQSLGLVPEGITFEEMVQNTKTGMLKIESRLIQTSLYQPYLLHWLKYFPMNQIHIVDGDKFAEDPLSEIVKVERFLGVPPKITEKHLYFDEKKEFYCYIKNKKRRCLPEGKGREHPRISEEVLNMLMEFFASWNERFFKTIGRRFDWSDTTVFNRTSKHTSK